MSKRGWCSRCGARYDDGGFHGPGFCGKVHGGYQPTAEGPPPTNPPPKSAARSAGADELLLALREIADWQLVTRSFSDYRDSFYVMRDIARHALEEEAAS